LFTKALSGIVCESSPSNTTVEPAVVASISPFDK
jgi:hypothetical protein